MYKREAIKICQVEASGQFATLKPANHNQEKSPGSRTMTSHYEYDHQLFHAAMRVEVCMLLTQQHSYSCKGTGYIQRRCPGLCGSQRTLTFLKSSNKIHKHIHSLLKEATTQHNTTMASPLQ